MRASTFLSLFLFLREKTLSGICSFPPPIFNCFSLPPKNTSFSECFGICIYTLLGNAIHTLFTSKGTHRWLYKLVTCISLSLFRCRYILLRRNNSLRAHSDFVLRKLFAELTESIGYVSTFFSSPSFPSVDSRSFSVFCWHIPPHVHIITTPRIPEWFCTILVSLLPFPSFSSYIIEN